MSVLGEPSALLAESWEEPGDLEAIQQLVLRRALTEFKADVCTLYLLNPISGEFADRARFVGELRQLDHHRADRPRPNGLARQIVDERELIVEDLGREPEYESVFSRREGIRAFAGLALRAKPRPQPYAVLFIDYRQPRTFDRPCRKRLRRFGEEASALLQNAWLLDRYRRVIQLGGEINQGLDTVENLFTKLDQYVSEILDTSYFLMLADYSEQSQAIDLHYKYKGQVENKRQQPLTPGCRKVIEEGRSLIIHHYSEDAEAQRLNLEDIDPADRENPESLIFLPLLLRGVPLGVLSLQHRKPNAFGKEDIHVLEILANHLASALSSIRLFGDLDQINETGRLIARQAEVKDVLGQVLEATQADLAVLYPYHQDRGAFDPPKVAGNSQLEVHHRAENLQKVLASEEPCFETEASREGIASVCTLPLRVGGEVVGVLYLSFRSPQSFKTRQRHLCKSLAVYTAIAIESARRLEARDARRQREQEILQRIDAAVSRTFSLNEVLLTILEGANEIVGAENAVIMLHDRAKDGLKFAAWLREVPSDTRGGGITRWVFENARSVNIGNVQEDPAWREIYTAAYSDTLSELDVPLLDEAETIGVISFESPRPHAFSQEDHLFVSTLAGQVVLAIKKAQVYDLAERRANQLQALTVVSQEIIRQSDNPDQVMKAILEQALKLTSSMAAGLDLYEKGAPVKNYHCQAEGPGEEPTVFLSDFSLGEASRLPRGIRKHVAESRQAYRTQGDAQEDPHFAEGPEIHSQLAVPFVEREELISVLYLDSQEIGIFDDKDAELLCQFADEAVIAIQTARSHERAKRKLSRFEALWRVGNRLAELNDPRQRKEAGELTAQEVADQRGCGAVIRLYDEESGNLALVASSALPLKPFERMSTREGINGLVFRRRRTVRINDTRQPPPDMPVPKLADPLTRSLLVTPIQLRDAYYGNLSLSHRLPNYFTESDDRLAEGLATLLAITYQRLQAIQEQRELLEWSKETELMSWILDAAFGLAHRLNNDLGIVLPWISLALESLDNKREGEVRGYLERIQNTTDTVLGLAERLKEEAGRPQEQHFRSLGVEQLKAMLEEKTAQLPAVMETELWIQPDAPAVYAIPEHVADILGNLIENARDAQKGSGRIVISSRTLERFVEIKVCDYGPGIPEELRDKIFGFLFSSKGSSGFGLWSARRKAAANGGRLELEPANPKCPGATFRLLLPRADQRLEAQFQG